MNYSALGIVLTITIFVTGIIIAINKYIDNAIQTKYEQRVADYMLEQQNKKFAEWKIDLENYKKNAPIKKQQTQDKVNEVTMHYKTIHLVDKTCEVKLKALQDLLDIAYTE